MKKQYHSEEILKTREFKDLYASAVDYCEFIENYNSKDRIDFLQITRHHLLNLYDQALKLQWIDLQSNIEYEDRLDREKLDKTKTFISNRLEDSRYYWHVYDPTNENDTEAVCGDLTDDLGDIYIDLKFSIMTFNLNKPDCQENALWQFKCDFDSHWDKHCINALYAIHFFLQNKYPLAHD